MPSDPSTLAVLQRLRWTVARHAGLTVTEAAETLRLVERLDVEITRLASARRGPDPDPAGRILARLEAEGPCQRVGCLTAPSDEQIRLAWHDVCCPEAEDCRDRALHAAAQTIVNSGVVHAFLTRLGLLEDPK